MERELTKKQLQHVKKHAPEENWKLQTRWRVEFEGVTMVTDAARKVVITAWPEGKDVTKGESCDNFYRHDPDNEDKDSSAHTEPMSTAPQVLTPRSAADKHVSYAAMGLLQQLAILLVIITMILNAD